MLALAPVCAACGAWFGDLQPLHFRAACPYCSGAGCAKCLHSGLHPQAAGVRLGGLRFDQLLRLSVDEALPAFQRLELPSAAARLRQEIERRLLALQRVGLGYISLERPSPTLSRGEAQRVRLALTLISRLEDMLHILDEPTIGQHPADVPRLLPAFGALPGPVIFVEHDRLAAASADQAIDLGPGAGVHGGEVVFQGTPFDLWQAATASGEYFSLRKRLQPAPPKAPAEQFITIHDAHLRNLQHIDVPIPLGRLSVITGVSGSGKSTLVEDVLVASLESGAPVGCASIRGPALKPVLVDQSPIGRNPRSNPATYTKLADLIRKLYALAGGFSPSHFSFNRPEGACPTCKGMGMVEVAMRYLPPTWLPCPDCDGERFTDEVLSVRLAVPAGIDLPAANGGLTVADFLDLTVSQALTFFQADATLPAADRQSARHILQALEDIGLGYLTLGQPSPSLSGGEAQRVKLARYLGGRSLSRQLLVLDEPSTGLHPQDLGGLLCVLQRLVHLGATIVMVEHNTDSDPPRRLGDRPGSGGRPGR